MVVDRNPVAPVLELARYGIADDILESVPELVNQIKKGRNPSPSADTRVIAAFPTQFINLNAGF